MVLRDDGRTVGLAQCAVQPLQSSRAQFATRRAGHRRVEHHQPHIEVVNGILNETVLAGQVRMLRKYAPQSARIVVIADGQIKRHSQRSEELGQQRVFLDAAVIG